MEVATTAPVVQDFDQHVPSMIDFHRRYLACNKATFSTWWVWGNISTG